MKKYFLCLLFMPGFVSAQADKPYFQQEVNYKISVTLDDNKNDLQAEETVEYINNSPDELPFIWFHIWPNAYKNNQTALAKQLIADGKTEFYFAKQEERSWIDGLDFKVNGQAIKTEPHPEHIDIVKLVLNQPLKSGEKISISTPYHVHIPIGVFSRLGHIGQQYQVTQWYPKPAVYDKYGWHAMPYLNQGEFYSEFGSFDVSITLPKNYVVGATGTLVNGEEETAWLMQKAEETKAILKYNPVDTAFPASSAEMKTLRYQAQNVHDFGWFADKRYHVLHDEVTLPHSKNKVDTWVMFTNLYGKSWEKAVKYVSDAVYYYSLWNGDYPYPHATAVDGALSAGGGMEYPMITVIGAVGGDETLDRVIAHEVGHNWFYGILGSNERDHAWMDEGVNSFNENRYMKTKYKRDSVKTNMEVNVGGLKLNVGKILGIPDLDESSLFELAYRFNAATKKDQPIDQHSAEYTSINYGAIVYGKTALVLAYLQAYLGTDVYDKCAQTYFEKWKFHHPYPADIKKVYEEVSGKDLGWFFNEVIPTTKQVDYKICNYQFRQGPRVDTSFQWEVTVRNKGEISSPFSLSALKDGKVVATQWFDGFSGKKKVIFYGGAPFNLVKIDAQNRTPDINRQNNTLKTKGLFKQVEPFSLHLFGGVHNTNKTQLFLAPVAGWNNYNKLMIGAALYNNILPEKKFEWVLMPMYSFHNKDLAGGASVFYNMHFNKIFQTVRVGVNADRYSYSNDPLIDMNFEKIAPEVSFEIKKKHLNSPLKQVIRLRHVNVTKEIADCDYSFSQPICKYDSVYTGINDISYLIRNARKIHPFNVALNVQQGEGFVKSSVTANYRITFRKNKKGLDVRLFAGTFIRNEDLTDGNYFFNAAGATGGHDYLYDNIFLGRSEMSGFLSRQFAETEGNMKVYTPLGRSNSWLAALNVKCPLPGKLPFKLFADVNFIPSNAALKETMLYDAGLYIPLVKDMIEVYLPLVFSGDIKDVFYLNNPDLAPGKDHFKRMGRMIRFTFNIHKLNPFELVRNADL